MLAAMTLVGTIAYFTLVDHIMLRGACDRYWRMRCDVVHVLEAPFARIPVVGGFLASHVSTLGSIVLGVACGHVVMAIVGPLLKVLPFGKEKKCGQDMKMLVPSRRRLRFEVWIVLGLSLGQSAVYSVVQLLEKMTRAPLSQGTSTLNRSQSTREYFDLTYQLLDIIFALVPVLLVIYFLTDQRQTKPGHVLDSGSAFRKLGFDFARPGKDLMQGLGLAALIGIPSLGLYAVGRALGITTAIIPSALDSYWWTVPVLVLSAMRHAVVEEVIVVGYLLDRFAKFGWSLPLTIFASSMLRGSYHVYQGFGPFVGNAIMGVVFAWVYTRTRRVMPLVIGHGLINIVAFVGFSLFGRAGGRG